MGWDRVHDLEVVSGRSRGTARFACSLSRINGHSSNLTDSPTIEGILSSAFAAAAPFVMITPYNEQAQHLVISIIH